MATTPVLNKHIFPPGGFYFVDSEGVRFDAENAVKLASAIREYRILNGKPIGNPLQEVNDFTCARYPTGCRGAERIAPVNTPGIHLVGRVNRWLSLVSRALGRNSTAYVSKDIAEMRAKVCVACPKQKNWHAGCLSCNEGSRRLSFAARKGQETSVGEKLLGCDVLGEDTRTSVFLDKLTPSENPDLPANCWRKKK